jgi:WD40 repeat protein
LGEPVYRRDCSSRQGNQAAVEVGLHNVVLGALINDACDPAELTLSDEEVESFWQASLAVARRVSNTFPEPPPFDESKIQAQLDETREKLAASELPWVARLALEEKERSLLFTLERKTLPAMTAYSQLMPLRRNAAIYEKYSGKVVAMQVSLVPIEAHVKLVQEGEQNGKLEFHDDALRQAFWKRMDADMQKRAVPPEAVDFSRPVWMSMPAPEPSRVEGAIGTLTGHRGGVNRLAFSPDGSMLACAVGDYMSLGEVVVWDTDNWQRKHTLRDFKKEIMWIKFSPNGRFLAAHGVSDPMKVFEMPGGALCLDGTGVTSEHDAPSLAAFSQDSRSLFAAGAKTEQWNLDSGKTMRQFERAACVACSPDGRTLATGGDGGVVLWELSTRKRLATLPCEDGVKQVMFSSAGKRLTAVAGSTIHVWNTDDKEQIASMPKKASEQVHLLAGSYALAVDRPQLRLWDLDNPEATLVFVPGEHSGAESLVCDAVVSAEDDLFASVSIRLTEHSKETKFADRVVELWSLSSRKKLAELAGLKEIRITFGYAATALAYDPVAKLLAVAAGNEVAVWHVPMVLEKEELRP